MSETVKYGDIFALGKHRIMCGDATNKEDVNFLLQGSRPSLVVTSPPYLNSRSYDRPIACWDALMHDTFAAMALSDDAHVFVNLGVKHRQNEIQFYWQNWLMAMGDLGWRTCGMYVWDKMSVAPGNDNGRPRPCHEFIFLFNKKNRRLNKTEKCSYYGSSGGAYGLKGADNSRRSYKKPLATPQYKVTDSVFRIASEKTKIGGGHPAVFPVALPTKLISMYQNKNDICYDPFVGSGTTLEACEIRGLAGLGMEIAPSYVQIAINRWNMAHPDQIAKRLAERKEKMKEKCAQS